MKTALGTIEDRDSQVSPADVLAEEMNETAVRYSRMAEQLDSVLRADRTARRDAWSRQRKATTGSGHTASAV